MAILLRRALRKNMYVPSTAGIDIQPPSCLVYRNRRRSLVVFSSSPSRRIDIRVDFSLQPVPCVCAVLGSFVPPYAPPGSKTYFVRSRSDYRFTLSFFLFFSPAKISFYPTELFVEFIEQASPVRSVIDLHEPLRDRFHPTHHDGNDATLAVGVSLATNFPFPLSVVGDTLTKDRN